jgi:ribose transport system permease protein
VSNIVNADIAGAQKAKSSSGFMHYLGEYKMILGLFIIMAIAISYLAPEFWSLNNISTVLRQASIVGIVAVGMTFVILSGGIDLSVGAVLAVCGVVFAYFMRDGYPIWAAIVLTAIIGAASGVVNGVGVTFFRIQPFIMTLATMAIGGGIALIICTPIIYNTKSAFLEMIGNGFIPGTRIPGPTIIFLLGALISGIILRYFPFGRFVFGVGGSRETARLSGVRTTRILLIVYGIAGLCAAIGGVIQSSQLMTGDPNAGRFIMLDSIAAVVIGGTSLAGGRGSIAGTVAGVLLLSMVSNLLNLTGVSPFYQDIVKGLIIIVAIIATSQGLKEWIKQQWSGL